MQPPRLRLLRVLHDYQLAGGGEREGDRQLLSNLLNTTVAVKILCRDCRDPYVCAHQLDNTHTQQEIDAYVRNFMLASFCPYILS